MYGVTLEGGGAKGAYHLGAYRAILENDFEISAIVGTSVGALNGAMIAQGDFDIAYELWQNVNYTNVINANEEEIRKFRESRPNKDELRIFLSTLREVIVDGGFDITPLKNLIDTYINEDLIRKSRLDYGLVTVNVSDLKPLKLFKEDIPVGEMKEYILASCYLPVFKRERINGKYYLDGAYYDNLPYKMLIDKGFTDLILIRTKALGITRKIPKDKYNIITISPSDNIGNSFTYEKDLAIQNLKLGYYDALKVINGLKGNKYYFYPLGEEYYFHLLSNLKEDCLESIAETLNITEAPNKRTLFEIIIPRIAKLLDLNDNYDYEDFVLFLIEVLLAYYEIEKFKIYEFKECVSLLQKQPALVIPNQISTFEKILVKANIMNTSMRDDILIKIAYDMIRNLEV
ncbi:MAG: patatin-like phospholipase family protein [Tissierellales bacterium]|nr:patatin-like phospholipase family protein [Tissierellales bacterium]